MTINSITNKEDFESFAKIKDTGLFYLRKDFLSLKI